MQQEFTKKENIKLKAEQILEGLSAEKKNNLLNRANRQNKIPSVALMIVGLFFALFAIFEMIGIIIYGDITLIVLFPIHATVALVMFALAVMIKRKRQNIPESERILNQLIQDIENKEVYIQAWESEEQKKEAEEMARKQEEELFPKIMEMVQIFIERIKKLFANEADFSIFLHHIIEKYTNLTDSYNLARYGKNLYCYTNAVRLTLLSFREWQEKKSDDRIQEIDFAEYIAKDLLSRSRIKSLSYLKTPDLLSNTAFRVIPIESLLYYEIVGNVVAKEEVVTSNAVNSQQTKRSSDFSISLKEVLWGTAAAMRKVDEEKEANTPTVKTRSVQVDERVATLYFKNESGIDPLKCEGEAVEKLQAMIPEKKR